MWSPDREGTPKRARPNSLVDGYCTPEKRAVAWQAADPGGLHPRCWDAEQLCDFLRRSGFEEPELLRRFRGEREKGMGVGAAESASLAALLRRSLGFPACPRASQAPVGAEGKSRVSDLVGAVAIFLLEGRLKGVALRGEATERTCPVKGSGDLQLWPPSPSHEGSKPPAADSVLQDAAAAHRRPQVWACYEAQRRSNLNQPQMMFLYEHF